MRFLFLPLFCLIHGVCLAQMPSTASAQPLSMEEAASLAVKNNPRLSAASREVLAAELGLGAARARVNPEITVVPGLTSVGSDEELLVRQPLELNGTREARTGVARAQLRRTRAQAVVELRSLVADTKSAYVAVVRARERLALAREALTFSEEFNRIATLQLEAGARPGIEVTQTGVEVARSRQQMQVALGDEQAAIAALNTLMGRPPAASIGALALPSRSTLDVDSETLARQALAARAEIEADEALAEAFRQEGRLARAEGRPDLAPQVRAESLTRGSRDVGIGIGITLPLLDFGGRRNRIRQAEEAARAQGTRAEATRRLVRQEVEQAVARVRASESALVSYEQGVLSQSRRLLDAALIGFREGKTSIVGVLEAQRTFRAVQNEYATTQADYANARAELERATGTVPSTLLPVVRRTK